MLGELWESQVYIADILQMNSVLSLSSSPSIQVSNMSTTTTTTTTTTTPTIPRGPITAEISFIVPWPSTKDALFNYVEAPPEGQPPRNFDEVPTRVPLTDIRGKEHTYNLDRDALQVLHHVPTKTTYSTFDDDEEVKSVYYPEVEGLILSNVPGAHKVVIFDHTIRRQRDGANRRPVTRAHVDQTPAAAAERVRIHVQDAEEAERLLQGRYRIINVWRPINGTVVSAPLAVAEPQSVNTSPDSDSGSDLLHIEHRYPHRTGEIFGVRYNPGQRWNYLSGVEGDERLLIKCSDSVADLGVGGNGEGVAARLPHSAFVDPRSVEGEGGKPRESIEVRALVFG